MKGLINLPSSQDLERAYAVLLHAQPQKASAANLTLFSQWSRFDARLGEILVSALAVGWREINPLELRDHSLAQPWPAAMAVILEFVTLLIKKNEDRSLVRLFIRWKEIVIQGVSPAPHEQYFIGLEPVGAPSVWEGVRFPLRPYAKWGYFSRDSLLHRQGYDRDRSTRLALLNEMLKTTSRITIAQYQDRIGHCISRRQAERDLLASPTLRPVGRTRGRYFVKKSAAISRSSK